MIAVTLAVAGAGTASVARSEMPVPRAHVQKHRVSCREGLRAVRFYRRAYARWRASMALSGPQDAILTPCWHVRRAGPAWREKAREARAAWVREYDWPSWLPDKWQRLGACETGGGVRPGHWWHANGSYVSAFGISRTAYDEDAAVYGAPPWSDARVPTPHQQYLAALGHYRLHNRFSGWGCRGA